MTKPDCETCGKPMEAIFIDGKLYRFVCPECEQKKSKERILAAGRVSRRERTER